MMQINVLQIAMVCISSERFTMSQIFVSNVLAILLRLYESRSKAVVSTAKAALNQLFSHVVNDLIKNSEENKETEITDHPESDEESKGSVTKKMTQLNNSAQTGMNLQVWKTLLKGLVLHLNPEKETNWPVPVNNSTTALALDLLSLIISEGKDELSKFKEILLILDEVFDPLLNQISSMKSNFSISIRLINWITLFAIHIQCGLEVLTRWCLTFINIKANNWQKLIAFESFTFIFNSKTLVKNLSESDEQWCLANILKVFEQYLMSINEAIGDDVYGHHHQYYQSQRLYKHLEDKNFDTIIQPPDTAVLVKLLIEWMYNASCKFIDLSSESNPDDFKHKILNSQHLTPILSILSHLLHICSDEINIQCILNTFQNIFCLWGKSSLPNFKSSLLNSMSKYALPSTYERLSQKNILVIKKLINICHWLNTYLDAKWWYYIFRIMQRVEGLVREEMGMKGADEDVGKLVNDSVRKEIDGIHLERALNHVEVYDPNAKSEEKVGYEEHKVGKKVVQHIRASKGKRKTKPQKQEEEEFEDFSPIGRSKTVTGHRKGSKDEWHDEVINSELYKIDLDQIHTSLNSLFKTTLKFSDDLIKDMIAGLGELTVNNVEEQSSPTMGSGKKTISSRMVPKQKKNLFSLRKMTEIALVNIYRVSHFWQIIIDQLMVISVCNNPDYRSLALEAFTIIVTEILQMYDYKEDHNFDTVVEVQEIEITKQKNKSEEEEVKEKPKMKQISIKEAEWSASLDIDEKVTPTGRNMGKRIRLDSDCLKKSDSESEGDLTIENINEDQIRWDDEKWQIKVLKPFLDSLTSTSYEEDQLQIIHNLNKILEFCSPNPSGWSIIITFLCSINFSRLPDRVFPKVYSTLSHIATTKKSSLSSSHFRTLLKGVRRYAVHRQGTFEYEQEEKDRALCCRSSRVFWRLGKYFVEGEGEGEGEERPIEMVKAVLTEAKVLFFGVQFSYVIRRSTLQAVEKIVGELGENVKEEIWEYALDSTLLGILDKAVSRYVDQLVGFSTTKAREIKQIETSQAMQTPTFSFATGGSSNNKKGGKKGQGRRMIFDDKSIQEFHQRNARDSSGHESGGFGLPPEETPKTQKPSQASIDDQSIWLQIMKIFDNAIEKYNTIYGEEDNDCYRNISDMWIQYSKIISPLINNSTAEILKGVLETLDFFINTSLSSHFFSKYDSVALGIFEEINSVIQRKTDLVLTMEVTEKLVKIYKQIFTPVNIQERPQLLNPQNLSVTLHILRIILINARPTIGLNAMRQENSLKDDEKLIFDFIEFLGDLLHENDEALKYYLSFLLNFINYDPNEPHYEMFVRRTFTIISEGILKDKYSPYILNDLFPELYKVTSAIVDLRYHNTSCMSLVFAMKTSASLFETAGMFLLQITSYLLDKEIEDHSSKSIENPTEGMKKPNLTIEIPEYEGDEESKEHDDTNVEIGNVDERDSDEEIQPKPNETHSKKHSFNTKPTLLRAIDEEDSILLSPNKSKSLVTLQGVQDMILNKIMDLLKETLLFDISKIEKHNKAVKDAVIKSSQDLDVQVINFIINTLLPHAYKLGKKFEHTLVSIIDKGCNGYLDAMSTSGMNMFGSSSTVLAQSNSLSTYCFDNLFELCSYKHSKKNDHLNESKRHRLEEIRRKIAKTTTPILLERWKDTLQKFLYDEMRSGSIMMSQQRAEEVVFIMEKLKNLDVYPGLLHEIVQDQKPKFDKEGIKLSAQQLEGRQQLLHGPKSHLFYFIPLFSQFITSKEDIVKEALKEIFLEIALSHGIHPKMELVSGLTSNGELSLF